MDDHKIEQYRQPWESEDHWKLRKEFILKYQDQFPEYTLIALSQVHSDTELHGKSFPVPVLLPGSQECQKITGETQEGDLQLSEEMKQSDPELPAEEQEDTKEQEDAEGLGEEWEEEQEDPEMFVEVLEEDHEHCEMLHEKNPRNDPETSYGQSVKQDRTDLRRGVEELQDEAAQNNSQSTSRNEDSACLQSSSQKDIQFDALSESSNDESRLSSTQANILHPDSSAESSGELPESLKENLVDVFQFVKKQHGEKINPPHILDKLAKNFHVKVECLSEELRKAKCVHVCSVLVDGVSISMGKASTKKSARRQAVNLAVARLMNINWLLVKANFSFSKLSEIVCATKQNSSQNTEQRLSDVEGLNIQAIEFSTVPEKILQGETGWNSSQDVQTSGNMFESSSGQNELQYNFYGNLEGQSCAMQSSYTRSEESCSSEKVIQGMLPRSFKDNFVDVYQYIKTLHDEKLNGLQILEKVSKRFNVKVEFNCVVFNHAKSIHHCTVEIDGVLISRGKGLTKKNARRDAGKLAIDRLLQLLTRAQLSYSYRNKLSSADMSSLGMLGDHNRSETMPTSMMYENYSYQFDSSNNGNKTRHSSSDSAMRSSKSMQSVNSYAVDALPTTLKAKFRQTCHFVRKSLLLKMNPVSILNNASQKFKLGVKFKVKENHFLSHECFVYIGKKMFVQVEGISEREARFNAAKLAVDRIIEISDKARGVGSSKEHVSLSAFVASLGHGVAESKNGLFADGTGITSSFGRDTAVSITSSFGRDTAVSYPSKSSITPDPVVDAYKNSSWLLNVMKYNCTVNPEIAPRAAQNSGLTCVSQNSYLRKNVNSENILNETNQNANRSGNENLSRCMVDYPRQNLLVRSSYPAQSKELSYARSSLLSSIERSNISCSADIYNLPGRAEKYDLSPKTEKFDLPAKAEKYDPSPWEERFNMPKGMERFDLSNTSERFDLPNYRTERFDLSNRTERFDLSNRTERFDLPNNRTERFDLPNNRTERFDLPDNRTERFDLPNNRTERFDMPGGRERFDLPNNRTERFDMPGGRERFDLPNNRMERFNIPNKTDGFNAPNKTDRFDLPNRAERFDLPCNAEQHDLLLRAERGHMPSQISGRQNWAKDESPKVWLHEL